VWLTDAGELVALEPHFKNFATELPLVDDMELVGRFDKNYAHALGDKDGLVLCPARP
jgi:hypothetical protein